MTTRRQHELGIARANGSYYRCRLKPGKLDKPDSATFNPSAPGYVAA